MSTLSEYIVTDILYGASMALICAEIDKLKKLPLEDLIEALNVIRYKLHSISPFKNEPVDFVKWVPGNVIQANDYNPNNVAPPEMELLHISILADGFTQPIVTNKENGALEVVDGFHRNRIGKESQEVSERIHGYLPTVQIRGSQIERNDRIAATIRHNRARGKHQVDAMSDIVLELKRRNWSDEKIGRELGMDPDEVLRLTQLSGLAEMFANVEFSEAWEAGTIDDTDQLVEIIEDEKNLSTL